MKTKGGTLPQFLATYKRLRDDAAYSKTQADQQKLDEFIRRGFDALARGTSKLPRSFAVASLPAHRRLNRYSNILPFDDARVELADGRYINASPVQFCAGAPAYVAAQGPVPESVDDFWQMVVELEAPAVLMLTRTEERGVLKCHPYWPTAPEDPLELSSGSTVKALGPSRDVHGAVVLRLRVFRADSSGGHEIDHVHFADWSDFGTASAAEILQLVEILNDSRRRAGTGRPAIVHCSAGVGRTGTFCAVDTALALLEGGQWNDDGADLVLDIVREFRRQRVGMVQTPEQLRAIYDALLLAFGQT